MFGVTVAGITTTPKPSFMTVSVGRGLGGVETGVVAVSLISNEDNSFGSFSRSHPMITEKTIKTTINRLFKTT